jgi:hypothetical protein
VRIRYDSAHPARFEVVDQGSGAALSTLLPIMIGFALLVAGVVGIAMAAGFPALAAR